LISRVPTLGRSPPQNRHRTLDAAPSLALATDAVLAGLGWAGDDDGVPAIETPAAAS